MIGLVLGVAIVIIAILTFRLGALISELGWKYCK
jgi:hypothetical protein